MESVLIIGRGPSVLRCKKEWTESFKSKAIVNDVCFKGFEDKIGFGADYWFKGWRCPEYSPDHLKLLGIKTVVNTTTIFSKEKRGGSFPEIFPEDIECLFPDLFYFFQKEHNINPSTGITKKRKPLASAMGMTSIRLYENN